MQIETFRVAGLGHQSYLISDPESGQAAVIDLRRDIEVYLDAAARARVTITHVFETHVHNDYITGARELAGRIVTTIVTAAAGVAYEIPRDRPVATVCRTGHRAEMAASIVAALGREVIAVQRGGMPEWIARGLPTREAGVADRAHAPSLEHAHP